jgi:hypothetical protein
MRFFAFKPPTLMEGDTTNFYIYKQIVDDADIASQ